MGCARYAALVAVRGPPGHQRDRPRRTGSVPGLHRAGAPTPALKRSRSPRSSTCSAAVRHRGRPCRSRPCSSSAISPPGRIDITPAAQFAAEGIPRPGSARRGAGLARLLRPRRRPRPTGCAPRRAVRGCSLSVGACLEVLHRPFLEVPTVAHRRLQTDQWPAAPSATAASPSTACARCLRGRARQVTACAPPVACSCGVALTGRPSSIDIPDGRRDRGGDRMLGQPAAGRKIPRSRPLTPSRTRSARTATAHATAIGSATAATCATWPQKTA